MTTSKDKILETDTAAKKDNIYSKVNISVPLLDAVIIVSIAVLILLVSVSM